jgi:hypothetical protein
MAAERLRRALDEIGLIDTGFTTRLISSQAEADQAAFPGSPTFLADQRDLFPAEANPPGLSCRLYPAQHGADGAPAPAALREVLQHADPLLSAPR